MNGHYDIIGDVHGHCQILERLLRKLGYKKDVQVGHYFHPHRQAVFVGDLIDRGRENFETLGLVKAMNDNGSARVVMGNHEYNALCYHTGDLRMGYLRPHIEKNMIQHREVLEEIQRFGDEKWREYLEWFRRMPLFLELEGIRVVHACWHRSSIDYIKSCRIRDDRGRLTDAFLEESSRRGTKAFDAIDILLKGQEILLPQGHNGIVDKDGNRRKKMRVKWWIGRSERLAAQEYREVVRADGDSIEKIAGVKLTEEALAQLHRWDETESLDNDPVFFGHYWFSGIPGPLTEKAACLDYSVAKKGPLVCYRWDGETQLEASKFRAV